jgi:hypothetical protein
MTLGLSTDDDQTITRRPMTWKEEVAFGPPTPKKIRTTRSGV